MTHYSNRYLSDRPIPVLPEAVQRAAKRQADGRDDPDPAVPPLLGDPRRVRHVPVRLLPQRGQQVGARRQRAGALARRGPAPEQRARPRRHKPGQSDRAGAIAREHRERHQVRAQESALPPRRRGLPGQHLRQELLLPRLQEGHDRDGRALLQDGARLLHVRLERLVYNITVFEDNEVHLYNAALFLAWQVTWASADCAEDTASSSTSTPRSTRSSSSPSRRCSVRPSSARPRWTSS